MNDLTQARKLIKECRETQNPYLDLGKCGITDLGELPELFECTHLETLILGTHWRDGIKWVKSGNNGENNKISLIPDEISKLKKLTNLFLDANQISDIRFLANLTELQTLDLANNQIKSPLRKVPLDIPQHFLTYFKQ